MSKQHLKQVSPLTWIYVDELKTMSNKKQSSVEFIFNAFNLLSDADFKAWMLNNNDDIKAMHKEEIIDTFFEGAYGGDNISGEQYYNETFGGEKEVL